MEELTTYHGNCYCGRYRFDISVPEIKTAVSCKCSLCKKKASIWLMPPADSFEVMRDDGHLTEYKSDSILDKFCNVCGTQVVGEHLTGPLAGQFAVNIRTIREPYINPFQMESAITTIDTKDNRTFEPVKGPPSEVPAQHIFSCHCGQVQAELLNPIQDHEIKEDNCSACVRTGYIGVFPTRDHVRIHGRENGFEYSSGRKYGGTMYCKTCGVHVFGNIYGPPISIFDELSPERKEYALGIYHRNMKLQPLNGRSVEGVDISTLKINRSDEGTQGYKLDD